MSIRVDPDWWKHMFDEVYLITDARSVNNEEITRHEVDLICDLLPLEFTHRILDLCGGHGRHCFEFCLRGYKHCTLIDYSQYLVEHAKTYACETDMPVNVIQSDARNTGLLSDSFDLAIIMGNSLGYIPFPSSDRHILEEAYRLLRSGGWLLVDVTNGLEIRRSFISNSWHESGEDIIVCRQREMEGDIVSAREIIISRDNGLIRDQTYAIRTYDPESLGSLLEQAGLAQIDIITDFSPHQTAGDYGFMNHRMIATGRKI